MCGISGFLGDFTDAELHRMNAIQTHRGPDDHGVLLDGPVGLAHRRLSIIDVASGHQPLSNADGRIWIVFNGEIYNYQEIKENHLAEHRFSTNSDTEVIVQLYEKYGARSLEFLRGMFAFAIWDGRDRRLFLARDRFGIKPLYYTGTPRGFAFASEIKALLELDDLGRAVNHEAVDSYLTFRYVPGEETMLKGIRKLEPGHYMFVDGKETRTHRYWDIHFERREDRSEADYAEELRARLKDSIELRLIGDVPLGAYLSGGLDSSFIVGLMSQLKNDPVETFTVSLGGEWHDEAEYAEEVARAFGTKHHVLRVRADAAQILPRVVWHLDEPMADAATVPTYLMSELTRKYVTVVLSGEGADELLAGYDKYKIIHYGRMASWGLSRIAAAGIDNLRNWDITLNRLLGFLSRKDLADAYLHLTAVFSEDEKAHLIGPALLQAGARGRAADEVRQLLRVPGKDAEILDRLAYLDIKTWLPNDVLLKNDKMTMAHSLEARVPFLDHEFAEFIVTIPNRLKLRWFTEKKVLREAMAPLVPERIRHRRKHGFTVPVRDWMRGELKPMVARLLRPERLKERGFWNPGYVKALLEKDLGNEYYRRQLWTLVTFEIWYQIFIERKNLDEWIP